MAVITASSSLIASAITALIASVLSKRSLSHAADMAALDRAARLREQHRTARRDVYAAYVNSVLTTLRDTSMMATNGLQSVDAWKSAGSTASDSYNAAVLALGVVKMEAPAPLAERADELRECARDFLKASRAAAKPGIGEEERRDLREAAQTASDLVFDVLTAYTEEARADLAQ
ncbi:hypothetical protein ABT185_20970 [Streptomyces clavifer]|uniref:hypothetical protein n=1 Tax=Streptomyces clavifer TaxID=68188 RepID=UPI0033240BC8